MLVQIENSHKHMNIEQWIESNNKKMFLSFAILLHEEKYEHKNTKNIHTNTHKSKRMNNIQHENILIMKAQSRHE